MVVLLSFSGIIVEHPVPKVALYDWVKTFRDSFFWSAILAIQ